MQPRFRGTRAPRMNSFPRAELNLRLYPCFFQNPCLPNHIPRGSPERCTVVNHLKAGTSEYFAQFASKVRHLK